MTKHIIFYNVTPVQVELCEYGTEEDNQIRDRVLYFIRNKVLKRKLYREENLTLTKLPEIVYIFDKPDALLLTPSGTRKKPTLSTPGTLVVSSLHTEHFKENVGDAMALATQQEIVENLKTTHVRNAAKSDTSRHVATPGNHKVAPLLVASLIAVVEAWTEAAGEVVESRMLEALRNKTLEWRKVIHSMYSR